MFPIPRILLVMALILGLSTARQFTEAATVDFATCHVEGGTVEFSGFNNLPTSLGNFLPGINLVSGSVEEIGSPDEIPVPELAGTADIFTFKILDGHQLDRIVLDRFVSGTNLIFMGLDDANTFAYSASEINSGPADLAKILGGTTVGTSDVDEDVLDNLQAAGTPPRVHGSIFDIPLGAGDYTVYLQETGPKSEYTLHFEVSAVPEPSSVAVLSLGFLSVGALVYRRRKNQRTPTGAK